MAAQKRKLPVWAIILYSFTALILLAGVAVIIFGVINSMTILPYKRQAIAEYFSDEENYYTVSGTVEEQSRIALVNGAYRLTVTLENVTSDEEGINERGVVTFTLPTDTNWALTQAGFFDVFQEGAAIEFYMSWNVWGNVELASFTQVSVGGISYLEQETAKAELAAWIQNDLE